MSQKKVEQYKEYKKNKAKILKREKFMRRLELGLIGVICAVFVAWFAISVGQNLTKMNEEEAAAIVSTEVDMNAYADYIQGLTNNYTAEVD